MTRQERAARLRQLVLEGLCVQEDHVAVSLSAGIDSTSLLVGLLALHKKVTAYSFTLEDRVSTDFMVAKQTCDQLGVTFVGISLPVDPHEVIPDVHTMVRVFGAKKTTLECVWPYIYMKPVLREDVIAAGFTADTHFGISKKAMLHCRTDTRALDQYRRSTYSKPDSSQTLSRARLMFPKKIILPYRSPAVCQLFMGVPWDDVNRPTEKQTIRDAFPEMEKLPVWKLRHTNMQKGDSGIAELFERTAKSCGFKSAVGWYNYELRRYQNGRIKS